MPTIFPSGAMAVVKNTTRPSGHRPCFTSSIGPEIKVVACSMPAFETVNSIAIHTMANRMSAVQLSASARFSGSLRVRRSPMPQRTQSERMSGPSAGTSWNCPQPKHSRSAGLVSGGSSSRGTDVALSI